MLAPSAFCVTLPSMVRLVPFAFSVAAPVWSTAPSIKSVLIVPVEVCATVSAVMPSAPVTVIVPAPSCVRVLPVALMAPAVTSPRTLKLEFRASAPSPMAIELSLSSSQTA